MSVLHGDGPFVVIPAPLAELLAPPLRAWLRDVEARIGRGESLAAAAEIVGELERAAVTYRRRLMSADRSASGHSVARCEECPDPRPVDWISVDEAAGRLDVTGRHVRRLADGGLLRSWRAGRDRLIDASSVDAYVARRGS